MEQTSNTDKSQIETAGAFDDKSIIDAFESSDLGAILLRPIIKIIISFMKSSSSWLEGLWISNSSSGLGAMVISNSIGWFGITPSTLNTQLILYSIKYSIYDEFTINAKWKNLNEASNHGTISISPLNTTKCFHNINEIIITLNLEIIGTAKRMISLRKEICDRASDEEYRKEWIEPYETNKYLIECTPYKLTNLFHHLLNIPIFGYGTLGDRPCDGNNSQWNAPLIHGSYGRNAYISGWKLYQHPSHFYPFTDNKGNCKHYKLIGRLLQWNDVYINAFKIFQIDKICGYNRNNPDKSFFKRKIVVCNVINPDGTHDETECWLWFVDSYAINRLETEFDCIQSGDWKDRKYSKFETD